MLCSKCLSIDLVWTIFPLHTHVCLMVLLVKDSILNKMASLMQKETVQRCRCNETPHWYINGDNMSVFEMLVRSGVLYICKETQVQQDRQLGDIRIGYLLFPQEGEVRRLIKSKMRFTLPVNAYFQGFPSLSLMESLLTRTCQQTRGQLAGTNQQEWSLEPVIADLGLVAVKLVSKVRESSDNLASYLTWCAVFAGLLYPQKEAAQTENRERHVVIVLVMASDEGIYYHLGVIVQRTLLYGLGSPANEGRYHVLIGQCYTRWALVSDIQFGVSSSKSMSHRALTWIVLA